ncbi:MAG: hypothetical protein ACFCBW_18590 [Candidatus Competibacterales bacterium]
MDDLRWPKARLCSTALTAMTFVLAAGCGGIPFNGDQTPVAAPSPIDSPPPAPQGALALDITNYDSCVIRRATNGRHVSLLVSSAGRPELVMGVELPRAYDDAQGIIEFIGRGEYVPFVLSPNHHQLPQLIAALVSSGRLRCQVTAAAR